MQAVENTITWLPKRQGRPRRLGNHVMNQSAILQKVGQRDLASGYAFSPLERQNESGNVLFWQD
jgi:hypothetical protein